VSGGGAPGAARGDHFSVVAPAYAQWRPTYPEALFATLAALAPSRNLAWDVGCGSGQASVALAAHMTQVHATDVSAAQVASATPHPRVHYVAAPSDVSGLAAHSVSLVTVAQALHWFDVGAFHAEVHRVLVPGGVLAEWSYGLLETPDDTRVGAVVTAFDAEMGVWWPPERAHVDAGYATLPFPYERLTLPSFAMTASWTYAQLMGYLGTWSAVSRCRAATGTDPLAPVGEALRALLPDDRAIDIRWPLTVRAGRRPPA